MKNALGGNMNEILDAFKQKSQEFCGRSIVEASIIGDSIRFRWQGNGKLGVVVGDIGIRDATAAEYDELEESIELGQVQIYTKPLFVSGRNMAPQHVLHQATGFPINENSPAAIKQRQRLARAYPCN